MLIRIKCPFICTFFHQPHHDFLLSQVHLTCFILICLILSMTEDCSQPLTLSPLKNTHIQYNIFIQKITTHTHTTHAPQPQQTMYTLTYINTYIHTCTWSTHIYHTHYKHNTLYTEKYHILQYTYS